LKAEVESEPKVQSATRRKKVQVRIEMDLAEVLAGIENARLSGNAAARITAVACDSRKVIPGTLFFALPGARNDGNEFVVEALARGAVAIASALPPPAAVAQRFCAGDGREQLAWIELLPGADRKAMALAAANFYVRPAEGLKLVGVTGTNGKTTITYIVDSILRAAGFTTGRIGTTGYDTPQGFRTATNTTPESIDLQQMFAEVRAAGGTAATLEVSSHSLVMDRTWGCRFDVAIFTNLTRDHLNFHKTFEEYFAAKQLLFTGTGAGVPRAAVVNIDDLYGSRLTGLAERTLTYGLHSPTDLTAKKFALSFDGLEFTAQTLAGPIEVRSTLVGRINVYNILAAIGAALALDIPVAQIEAGIRNLELVPGRFQRIDEGQPFLVVVDYAHADDAMRNLIITARELNPAGRIITLFGAGGERDRSTRPPMGEAAGSLSDLVILTSDNPRSEDPLLIINDVVVGLQKVNANYLIEPDRDIALAMAIDEAKPGDMVLLAGKGHETYQILRDRTYEFDDREKAREILRRRGYAKKKVS
jgi:UDP-N-acetylmuramoyl-L-alanyl-D-glutamate--2,6-diaminopimelate ligase